MPKTGSKDGRMAFARDRTYDRRVEEIEAGVRTGRSMEKVNESYDRVIYGDPKPPPPQFAEPPRTMDVDRKRGVEVEIRTVHERDTINKRFKSRKVV